MAIKLFNIQLFVQNLNKIITTIKEVKNKIIPVNSYIVLPEFAANDYYLNKKTFYNFITSVDNKEILVDEKRLTYRIEPGDYLGKIARKFNVKVFQIKSWNKLNSSKLNIGDKLVLYVSDNINTTKSSGVFL